MFARSEERDFIDIYFLVRDGGYMMECLVELARRKDSGLDDYYLALAFEQAERLPDSPDDLRLTLFKEVDMRDLKEFFRRQAVKLLSRGLRGRDGPNRGQ